MSISIYVKSFDFRTFRDRVIYRKVTNDGMFGEYYLIEIT